MTTSRLYELVDALVPFLEAAFDGTSVEVLDGPRSKGTLPRQCVIVGYGGAPFDRATLGVFDGAESSEEESLLGDGTWRDETGTVFCTLAAWSGDSKQKAFRSAVAAMEQTIRDALEADPTVGGALGRQERAAITERHLSPQLFTNGAGVDVVLAISYRSVLT